MHPRRRASAGGMAVRCKVPVVPAGDHGTVSGFRLRRTELWPGMSDPAGGELFWDAVGVDRRMLRGTDGLLLRMCAVSEYCESAADHGTGRRRDSVLPAAYVSGRRSGGTDMPWGIPADSSVSVGMCPVDKSADGRESYGTALRRILSGEKSFGVWNAERE